MKKALSFFLMALICLVSVFAQGGSEKSEVYYLNYKAVAADIYTDEVAPAFEEETGISLKVVTAASNQYGQTLVSELAKNDPPDIFQVNGVVGLAGRLNDVAPLENTEFYTLLNDKSTALTSNGHVVAIPYALEGFGIIYNDAVMRKYFALPDKAVSLESAEEIKSFADLKAVVEDMTKHKDELGIKGVFASTSMAPGSDWRWTTHLMNLPLYAEFSENSEGLDAVSAGLASSEFKFKYNENFKQLFDLYLDNSTVSRSLVTSRTIADAMAEFALGDCAMVQNGNWATIQILGVDGNTVASEDIKFMPVYMGLEGEEGQGICIGTENYFCINSNISEQDQKNADTYLTWLFSSDTGKKLVVDRLGFIADYSSLEGTEPSDVLAVEMNKWMQDDSVNTIPWVFSCIPSDQWKSDFGSALLEYVNETMDWDEVVEIAQSSWAREAQLAGR